MADIENGHAIGRLWREIKAKEEYYKDREHEIKVFMENVAHQLKTPLAAVSETLIYMAAAQGSQTGSFRSFAEEI